MSKYNISFIKYSIIDIPEEILISIFKDLDYTDIINFYISNKYLCNLCNKTINWKLIFKIKYSITLSYLTKRNLDKELNYKNIIKKLSILSDKKTNLNKYLSNSIRSKHLYAVHILIENYNIDQKVIENCAIRHLGNCDSLEIVKYLSTKNIDYVTNDYIF